MGEQAKQIDKLTKLLSDEIKMKEQYQNESIYVKQSEIELKEKQNQSTREINLMNRRVEEESLKNKTIIDELNCTNKKLSESNYELNLYKNNFNMLEIDNKNLLKQCDDQKILMTTISITKEKEISELKKLLDDTIHDSNIKLLNKDNM